MLIQTDPPPAEPVTLAEAKTFLRLDHDHEDGLITMLISAARDRIETLLGVAMIEREFRYASESGTVVLPRWPVKDVQGFAPKLAVRPVAFQIGAPTTITFTAGYGPTPSDVPAPLRQAMLLLVSYGYEHRDSTDGLPLMVQALIAPYRVVTP